ncbi:hypothetical protein WBQ28_17610 [Pseudomonas syringae pv. syringae]|uniref:hypothetical protein n=1 Tax=Pseudomonas syringae TaxID=317 RepID=UPI003B004B31
MTVDIEKLEALAKGAKSGGAEWSDLDINTERMYMAEGALVRLYEYATPAVLLELLSDNEALRGLYQMHKQTEAREMRDLKAENAGLKTGYEAYERVNAELRAECEALRKIVSDSATSCGAAVSVECSLDFMGHLPVEIFSVVSKLRNALAECADSLHGEMLQKFGGQLPDDMHAVTRRDYDRDMAEVAGYRSAMGKGEQS